MMLVAKDIYKCYHRRDILKGVDLMAKPGECVGVIGSNGCGKTTLLSILAGTVRADRGQIQAGGHDIRRNPKDYARSVAYVPQENPLIEELTVKDNMLLWYKGSRKRMKQDLEEGAAGILGIGPMLGRRVDQLSGGMKKRLSIACALSNHAPVLILDEPGAALDMECKADIRRYQSVNCFQYEKHTVPQLGTRKVSNYFGNCRCAQQAADQARKRYNISSCPGHDISVPRCGCPQGLPALYFAAALPQAHCSVSSAVSACGFHHQ